MFYGRFHMFFALLVLKPLNSATYRNIGRGGQEIWEVPEGFQVSNKLLEFGHFIVDRQTLG